MSTASFPLPNPSSSSSLGNAPSRPTGRASSAAAPHFGPILLRLTLGLLVLPHSFDKLAAMGALADHIAMPFALVCLALETELVGGVLVLTSRALAPLGAAAIGAVMASTILLPHWDPSFAAWLEQTPGEGVEVHVIALVLALLVLVSHLRVFARSRP
jgi:uncharacterized membrane protein YphA (DoxX/SURF4 family)